MSISYLFYDAKVSLQSINYRYDIGKITVGGCKLSFGLVTLSLCYRYVVATSSIYYPYKVVKLSLRCRCRCLIIQLSFNNW